MIAKSRIEETLEDLDDFEVPKLRDNKTEEKSSVRSRKTDYSAMETDDEKSTSLNWKSPSKTESWKSSEPPKNEKVSMFAPSSRDDDFSDDDLDEYQCPSCPKKFLSKRLLDRHKSLCVEHNKTSNGTSEQKPDSSPKFGKTYDSGPKWTVQKDESGRSRESGRSVQKWAVLSQTGLSVHFQSFRPSSLTPWTVHFDPRPSILDPEITQT